MKTKLVAAIGKRAALNALLAVCVMCSGLTCTTTLVKVPAPAQDQAPTITIDAFPLANCGAPCPGDVEHQNTSVSGTLKASKGAQFQFSASAVNPAGGVQSLTITVAQSGATLYSATATQAKDSSGNAATSISVLGTGPHNNVPMTATMTNDVTVTSTATNFNGMSTSITVTYVPTGLTVSITANPTTIGYQKPPSSTLSWSVLYGVPPYKLSMNPQVVPDIVNTTSAVVAPSSSTQYTLSATDQLGTQTSSVWVGVVPPPPPPSVSLHAAPNDGYNNLGVPDTVSWSVTNCAIPPCNVVLTGMGSGYDHTVINLPHLNATGSISVTTIDRIDFSLTATSPFGSDNKKLYISIPPQSAPPSTNLTQYYFTVLDNNPGAVFPCFLTSVVSDTEPHAEAAALNQYGSGYSIGRQLTASEFNSGTGC